LQTLNIIKRHWSGSAVSFPPAVLGSDEEATKESVTMVSFLLNLSYSFPLLWVYALLVIALVVGVIWTLASVYIPLFDSYRATCVTGNPPSYDVNSIIEHSSVKRKSNGPENLPEKEETMLSNLLFSVSANYATKDGLRVITQGLSSYNSDLNSFCSSSEANDLRVRFEEDSRSLEEDKEKIRLLHHDLSLLRSAVNLTAMNNAFVDVCCVPKEKPLNLHRIEFPESDDKFFDIYSICQAGQGTQKGCPTIPSQNREQNALVDEPYLPLNLYFETVWLDENNRFIPGEIYNSQLANATIQCNQMPGCGISCSGPNPVLLQTATVHCSCMSEWYFHSNTSKVLAAIVVFILLNASRWLACRGVFSFFWRHLHPDKFLYQGVCSVQGKLSVSETSPREQIVSKISYELEYGQLYPNAIEGVDGITVAEMERRLKEKLSRITQRARIHGVFLIFMSILITLSWIVMLNTLEDQVRYSQG
jgi:hypothetical protein